MSGHSYNSHLLFKVIIGLSAIFLIGGGGRWHVLQAGITPQTENRIHSTLKVPYLGDHRFTPNNFVPDPFIKTYLDNTLGFGKALELEVPIIFIDGVPVIALQGDLMFLNMGFEYQYAVKSWLAAKVKISVLARLGTGTETLLAEGITAANSFELGWMFRLRQRKKSLLSAILSVDNGSTTIINLAEFIDGIIADIYPPQNQLVKKVPFLRTNGALRYARAFSDLFGLNAVTELSYGPSLVRKNTNKIFYKIGIALDVDLKSRTLIPFGIVFGFQQSTLLLVDEETDAADRSLFMSIGYNSPSDFSIGLDVSAARIPLIAMDKSVKAGLTILYMRYYF